MPHCCDDKTCEIEVLGARQASVLKIVLAINAAMFLVEAFAGILSRSTALLADSLDMLGDALVYGFSLWVISRGARWKAAAALAKGLIMAAFGLGVIFEAVHKVFHPAVPGVGLMGLIGALALAANMACLVLLWRHREDDINMRSTWLCSRNDVIANIFVLVAAWAVWFTESIWPDVLVGSAIAVLFLRSAIQVLTGAAKAMRS